MMSTYQILATLMCSFELETDDIQYETQKLRKLQEEMDRKGAANAQSHNEFLYI